MVLKFANFIKDYYRAKKNYVIPLCIFLVGIIVCLFIYYISVWPAEAVIEHASVTGIDQQTAQPSEILQNDRSITQAFHHDWHFSRVSVLVSTNSVWRLDNITMRSDIYDNDTGVLLATTTRNFEAIRESMLLEFAFNSPIHTSGGNYLVVFTPINLKPTDTLSVWHSIVDAAPAQIDGYELDGSLVVYIIRSPNENFVDYFYFLVATPLIFFFPILWYLIFVKKLRKENIFALSAVVLGGLYMLVFPPYSAYDEATHIANTFFRSSVLLGEEHYRDGNILIWQNRQVDNTDGLTPFGPDKHRYFHVVGNILGAASSAETVEATTIRQGPLYQYLPQTIGVTIARLLNLGQIPTLYLGRLFSLAVFISIMYFAIKIVKLKTLFILLSLAPFTLLTAGTFSAETMINALSFFFIAYTLYLAFSSKLMRKRDYIALLILGILIVPLNLILIPMLLLPLIIPKESYFAFRGAKVLFGALLLVAGLLSAFVFQATTAFGLALRSAEIDSAPWADYVYVYTMRHLFENPELLFRLLSVTMVDNLSTIPEVLGSPMWISFAVFSFLIITIMPGSQENQLIITFRQKIIMLSCAVGVWLFGHVTALPWTIVGNYYIHEAQGRFFIPLIPLLVIPLQTILKRLKDYDSTLIFATTLLNAYSIMFIFQRAIFDEHLLPRWTG